MFDHAYTTGSGKSRQVHRHTGFVFRSPRPVPTFYICREVFLDRLVQAVAGDDIDFQEDPDFSKRFKLYSSEVEQVRALFHPGARACLKNTGKDWALQGDGQDMYIFVAGDLASPAKSYEKLIAAKALFDSFDLHA